MGVNPVLRRPKLPPSGTTGGFLARCGLFGLLGAVLFAPVAAVVHVTTESSAQALTDALPEGRALTDPMPQRSVVRAADGSVLATFFRQDRVLIDLDEVAPVFVDAVLATEDADFYDHGAVDVSAIVRAASANAAAGGVAEGGSTLTQQYVKQALVLRAETEAEQAAATEASLERKLKELSYAIALEESLDKDEILTRYLNIVYFGNSAYGVEVAAQRYFTTSAADLTLAQATLLAGLIKAPNDFDPVANPGAARERRAVVLDRMLATGMIDAAQADAVREAPLRLKLSEPKNGCTDATDPYYCSYVLAELQTMDSLGPDPQARLGRLYDGGLEIRTTMQPQIQAAAQKAIAKHIGRSHEVGTAIVMTEPGDGAVRAIALNRRWGEGKGETTVNYALDKAQGGSSGFQAGSTFKPFVLAAALDEGISPELRLPAPADATFDAFENCETDQEFPAYRVGNYGDNGYGTLDMAAATQMSVNTYFLGLEERTGLCAPARIAEKLGLQRADGGDLSRVPSFVLGVDEVSPLRMAEAYATFAADGVHCDSYALVSVTDTDGEEFELPERECERAISVEVAKGVTTLLREVINGANPQRTGARMDIDGLTEAGKTGTTNNTVAVWFAGFTDDLAAAVWAGYPAGSKPLTDVTLRDQTYERLFGGALPGPIWRDAMEAALDPSKKDVRQERKREDGQQDISRTLSGDNFGDGDDRGSRRDDGDLDLGDDPIFRLDDDALVETGESPSAVGPAADAGDAGFEDGDEPSGSRPEEDDDGDLRFDGFRFSDEDLDQDSDDEDSDDDGDGDDGDSGDDGDGDDGDSGER